MDKHPLVTVIIPVYNGAGFLREALESVFSQIYKPYEVFVVDDGSTDATAAVARSFPDLQYFYQPNQGVSVARNTAIAAAGGEYIAFLDADDLWKPQKLSIQIDYMLEHPGNRLTATKAENFLEPGTELPPWLKGDADWKIVSHAIPSTMVAHKSVFDDIGGFAADYRTGEDTEWLWRARDAGINVSYLDDPLAMRRFHGSNLSWQTKQTRASRMLKIARESIARQSKRST